MLPRVHSHISVDDLGVLGFTKTTPWLWPGERCRVAFFNPMSSAKGATILKCWKTHVSLINMQRKAFLFQTWPRTYTISAYLFELTFSGVVYHSLYIKTDEDFQMLGWMLTFGVFNYSSSSYAVRHAVFPKINFDFPESSSDNTAWIEEKQYSPSSTSSCWICFVQFF